MTTVTPIRKFGTWTSTVVDAKRQLNAIGAAIKAASTDDIRQVLGMVEITGDPETGTLKLVSTNSYRLVRIILTTTEYDGAPFKTCVPAKELAAQLPKASELKTWPFSVRYEPGPAELDPGTLHLTWAQVNTRQLVTTNGLDYPNAEDLLDKAIDLFDRKGIHPVPMYLSTEWLGHIANEVRRIDKRVPLKITGGGPPERDTGEQFTMKPVTITAPGIMGVRYECLLMPVRPSL